MELKYESQNVAKDHPMIVKLGRGEWMLIASLIFIVPSMFIIFLKYNTLTENVGFINMNILTKLFYIFMEISIILLVCIIQIRLKALGYSQKLVYESDAVIKEISPRVTSGVRMVTVEAENQVYSIKKADAEVAKLRQGDVVKLELRYERTPYNSHKTQDFIDAQERIKKQLPIDDIEIKEHIIIKEA